MRWFSSAEFQFRHIGWHPVAYWIGRPASICLKEPDGTTVASLLASPDRLRVAWLHLFAAGNPPGARAAWDLLWPTAERILTGMGLPSVWAMTTQEWLIGLLKGSGFVDHGRVVAYSQQPSRMRSEGGRTASVGLLSESDLPEVERLDHAAFAPPWQMDAEALRATWERSVLATLLRLEGRIAGYLMAVATPQGVHLTRLAVHPDQQNMGIGRALIFHLLNHFHRLGAPRITVNTQIENRRSQRLYSSLGFREMEESYPVLRIDLPPGSKRLRAIPSPVYHSNPEVIENDADLSGVMHPNLPG